MKPPKPPANSNLKTGALIGAIVVVFAFCYWRISKGSTPQPQPVEAAPATVLGGPSGSGAPTADHSLIDVPAQVGSAAIDPFRTVLTPANSISHFSRSEVLRQHPGDSGSIRPPPLGGTLPAVASKLFLEPTMILKGVISGGPQGVAVLNINGKDAVVQQGAVIASGYRIAKVTDGSVTLRKGAVSMTLAIEVPGNRSGRPLH